jgi:fimbrial chaperone protein
MRRFAALAGYVLAAAALSAAAAPALAQGFAALVAPPRFELKTKPGVRLREVIEITNGSSLPARYRFRTADWSLGADGQVQIIEELQPKGCRPWVSIERHTAQVPGGGKLRYRFEVTPPADAPSGECRFALLIEGEEPAMATGENFNMPVRGRIGIIVYVAVGDAEPRLEIVDYGTVLQNGQRVPAIHIHNSGNAHGRVAGFLTATDAQGRSWDMSPSSLPILAGETRPVALTAGNERNELVAVPLPVVVRGALEWSGGRLPFERRFE